MDQELLKQLAEKMAQNSDSSLPLPYGGKSIDEAIAENPGPVATTGFNPSNPGDQPSLFDRVHSIMQQQSANGNISSDERSPASDENSQSQPTKAVPSLKQPLVQSNPIPQGYGQGLEDSDLAAAQKQANLMRLIGGLGNASSTISSALSKGSQKDLEAGAPLLAQADQGSKDIIQRRKAADEQLAHQKGLYDLATEKEKADPNSDVSKMSRGLLKTMSERVGMKLPISDNMSLSSIEKLYGPMERYFGMIEASENRKALNDQKQSEKNDKTYTEARQKLESFRGNSEVTQAAKNVLAGKNALSLIENKDPNTLTTADLRLLYEEMGKIASGGVPSEHGVQQMMPNTLRSKLASIGSFLTNKPTDAQAGEFIQHNLAYLKDMVGNAEGAINNYRSNILKGYKGRINEDQYNEILNDYPGVKNVQQPQKQPEMVKVVSPDGQIGMIPKANLEKAKARGFKESQ